MASQVTNYQCPNCTGPLHFDGESGMLECDYCDTEYEISVIEQLYADKEQKAAEAPNWDTSMAGSGWSDDESSHIKSYICPSCSAEIICDDTTAATSCPYCGNPTVVPGQLAGMLKPDYVIPFKLEKKQAVDALKKYYKGKKFLPKSFANDNHIEEVKGVYVPFWLFNCESEAQMRFRGTIVHKHTSGDEEIVITEHFRVMREGNIAFERVPADGSNKMPDTHMDAIEPFDYSEMKAFSTAYLPGFLADKYDLDANECAERANERIMASTESVFASTTSGYTSLETEYSNVKLKKGDVKYAMLPVWMLSTKWNGKDFLFAMNGQTGKLIGDLPIDKKRVFAWFFGIALPLMAIFGALLFVGGGIL